MASPTCTRSWPAARFTAVMGTSSMRSTTARRSARRPPSSPRNSSTAVAREPASAGPKSDSRRALLHFELHAADLGEADRVEQQDRAAVVGQRGSGIKPGGHHRGSRRLHHQLLMVVDAIDRQGVDVAAGRAQHDQRALVLLESRCGGREFARARLRARGVREWSRPPPRRDARESRFRRWRGRSLRSPSGESRNAGRRSTPSARE